MISRFNCHHIHQNQSGNPQHGRVAVCGTRVVAGDVRGAVMKWQIGEGEEVSCLYFIFKTQIQTHKIYVFEFVLVFVGEVFE